MASLSEMMDRIRGLDLERALGLRAAPPRIALEVDGHEFSLVRMRAKRGSPPVLEDHRVERFDEPGVPSSIFDQNSVRSADLTERFRRLLGSDGGRPGRVGLVLPDNLAKIALLPLPERPASHKQLVELVRFKMNRAVPFRLSDAVISFQVLPGTGRGVTVLVALMRRPVVERYEKALEAIGAKPGLVDLCTPNLLNLCRARIQQESEADDVALLNCTPAYFSLLIVRGSRLIFYRCKSYGADNGAEGGEERANGLFVREMAGSLSYYEEKLEGSGIGTMIVRSIASPFEEIREKLADVGVKRVEAMNPAEAFTLDEGVELDGQAAQRLAPALGAAVGRG
jgi:hypothetical protein